MVVIGCNQPVAIVRLSFFVNPEGICFHVTSSSQSCYSKCELRVMCMYLPQNNGHDWLNSPLRPLHEWGKEKKKKRRRSRARLGEEEEERLRRQRGRVEVSSIAYKLIEKSGVVETCCRLGEQSFLPVLQDRAGGWINCIKKNTVFYKSKKTQRERKKRVPVRCYSTLEWL